MKTDVPAMAVERQPPALQHHSEDRVGDETEVGAQGPLPFPAVGVPQGRHSTAVGGRL